MPKYWQLQGQQPTFHGGSIISVMAPMLITEERKLLREVSFPSLVITTGILLNKPLSTLAF